MDAGDDAVEIVEVAPRDGLQNEARLLPLAAKLELIGRAIAAGARRIEATSFVNPDRVPQMADADELAARLPRGSARFIGLALNARGFERAAAAGLDEVNFVTAATDAFCRRNQGTDTAGSLRVWAEVAQAARGRIPVAVTVSTAFGCPFEGEVPLPRLMRVVEAAAAEAPIEIALADTIGVATPRDIAERVGAVRAAFPDVPVRLHLHNTRNTAVACAWAGYLAGVRIFDAALGGIGGCPFAPAATGNVATEDLAYLFARSGVATGLDLEACIATARWLGDRLGHPVPGMVARAGGFPAPVPV